MPAEQIPHIRVRLKESMSHHRPGHAGGAAELLIFVAEMLLFLDERLETELAVLNQRLSHMEQRIMSDLQDIKDGFVAQDAKIDAIGVKVDALEAAIANSSAASDAAVAAALADVKAAQTEAATHIEALGGKFPADDTPPVDTKALGDKHGRKAHG